MNIGKLTPPTAITINSIINEIETGYARAEELRSADAPFAARQHQSTLAHHMVFEVGIRPSTLAMIDARTDLHCDGTGQVNGIRFGEGRATKTGRFERPLSTWLNECLQRHLEIHWPEIASDSSTLLFPHGIPFMGVHRIRRAAIEMLLISACSFDVGDAQ
jgi:hypothetical protein